jgi:hypothetical protein
MLFEPAPPSPPSAPSPEERRYCTRCGAAAVPSDRFCTSCGVALAAPFPVRLEVDYPERLSRLSTFFRLILAIPVVIILVILAGGSGFTGAGAGITVGALGSLVLAHWIAVLLRGRPVRWLFDVIVAIQRFILRALSYFFLLTDRYPPFEGEWPVRFQADCPERLSRWRLVIWKTATVIPHLIVLGFVFVGVMVAVFVAWFVVLFTGRYPRGLHSFVSGWLRWYARAWSYWVSLTDEFPSFSLSAEVGPAYFSSYAISAIFGWLIVLAWVGGISAVVAWPGETKEVTVSYQQLLQGEPSAAVEVFDVEVMLVDAEDPHVFVEGVYQPQLGDRFVQFRLLLHNRGRFDTLVEEGDFRLTDSLGEGHDPMLVAVGGREPPLWIREGGGADVWVMFEVDEDARPTELKYTPSFGFKQRVKFTFE